MKEAGLGGSSQNITGLSVLIAGKNTFGYTDDGTKPPEFEFETINGESTGIVKQPQMTLAFKSLGAEFIAHISAGLPFVSKGNIRDDGEDKPLLITAKGQLHKMGTDIKVGESVKREFELRLDMYSEVVDGIPSIVYSRKPYVCMLGGISVAPNFNNNI
jgi:hypothetical protein